MPACHVAPMVSAEPPAPGVPQPASVRQAKDLDARVFLIGDAGVPLEKDPVLAALKKDVEVDSAKAVVVYLGDNVYPRGLPPEGALGRKDAQRRLDAQVDAARAAGSLVLFIPGNHDWDKQAAGGWDAIKRQGEYLAAKGGAEMEPREGCPGPVVRDVHDRVRLVLLDTQWWLHAGPKPGKESTCPQKTEKEVADALADAIKDAGDRRVIVAGHHPLATGGAHGGYFSWQDHIFPLRAAKSWLWIPLPVIGSLYPGARRAGASAQDLGSPQNRKMREALAGVFEKNPPLAYASGHEHNLQVLKAPNPKVLLISGAGAYGHVTQTSATASTLFARAASGYMRLDVEKSGRVRLAVVTVAADGKATESLALDLTSEAKPTATGGEPGPAAAGSEAAPVPSP